MDNELEAQAIQTFAAVPEIYQQAFKEAGADFPDELVTAIKSDPNKAVELLSTNKDLKQAVISVFQQHKDAIMQYMQQQSSMFKNGGKFDYLRKLQQGGSLEQPKYLADEKPRGLKGWLFQATKYPRQDGQTGYFSEYITPAGDTLTTVGGRWNSWQRVARKGQQPRYQVAVGSDEYRDTVDPEAIEMLRNVHSRFLYPVKKQEGGSLKSYIQRKYNEAAGPLRRAWNNAKQSYPGQAIQMMLPIQTNTITTDENGNQMYAASPMFNGPKQAPYQWLPSKSYIESAKMYGTSMDDFLFNLKRNPKNIFKGKGKIKLNPTTEEVESLVSEIYGEPIVPYKKGGKLKRK